MKTTKTLLALSLFVTASLSAADDKFKLVTKVIVLPQEEFAAIQKFDGLIIPDGEVQVLMRDISQIKHAKMYAMPSIALQLNKPEQIEIVSEKNVKRIDTDDIESIGHTVKYRLGSVEGALTLNGIFKHSEIRDGEDPSIVAIETEEIIFKRNCEVDKSILVSNGDTHIFVTLTKWKEE